jgi:hypothetical protein
VTYYAVINDVIGGYDVSEYDKPVSEHGTDEHTVGSFMDEPGAVRVAEALNLLDTSPPSPDDLTDVACTSCGENGVRDEHHGMGLEEPLACQDCQGTGVVDLRYVAEWVQALTASGYTVTPPFTVR